MIRIYFLAFVICSGVQLSRCGELMTFLPHETDPEYADGKDYSVTCEVKDAEKIQWLDPNNQPVQIRRSGNAIFVEEKKNMAQLRFQPLNTTHAGKYTCVATIRGAPEIRKHFNLTVIKSIQFKDRLREYHAILGTSQTLLCEVESNPPAQIVWNFKDSSVEGDGYMILADGLQVNNVTVDKLGVYTCTASITTNKNGLSDSVNITLKEAVPPKITSSYKNNTVHGVLNTTVSIKCLVEAAPWPEIKWIRNNRELNTGNLNGNITATPNGSIIQFVLTKELLGNYTCKVANKFNTTSMTFVLEEGELPAPPTVHLRDTTDKALRLDITPNSSHELSNYRVSFKKFVDDDGAWKTLDFPLKDSPTNPYSINELEPNTDYLYKVGACAQEDLCAYTEVAKVKTHALATSSTNTVHTVVTQMLILLPAFILGLMHRHRTT